MRAALFLSGMVAVGVCQASSVDLLTNIITRTIQNPSEKFGYVGKTMEGQVVSVADGDTVTLLLSNQQQVKIRLGGIDAPEKAQAFGQASKKSLSDMAYKKVAVADCPEIDRYQRFVCTVTVSGLDLNKAQVERGMAWVYTEYNKRLDLTQAQVTAKMSRSGLWSDQNPTPPWQYRRESKN